MSIDTTPTDRTDLGVSPLRHFGQEVRLERERMGMSRADLGKLAYCGYSLVAKIESGERVATRDFAAACDAAFPHANGRFLRLWALALRYAFPPWFRPIAELEGTATVVRVFQPLLFPGLVQTPDYARAVLRVGRPANLEDQVTARIERQRILARDQDPARLWLILRESVLTNMVGDPAVMREQMLRLRDLAETPRHRVQIIRRSGPHYGGQSPWSLLSFAEGADVVHVDAFPRGYVLAEQADVTRAQEAYDLLNAAAEPPDETAALIDSLLREHYS